MNQSVFVVNRFLSLLTVLGDIFIIFFLLLFFFFLIRGKLKSVKKISFLKFLSRFSFHFALIVALLATLGSLFYSEIAKFTPCTLCWYQRILMYPKVILISLAMIKKDRHIADYLSTMSLTGASISLYHYYLQRGGKSLFPCSVVGYSASCTENFVMEFNYITIPVMAATAFGLIIVLMIISKYFSQK